MAGIGSFDSIETLSCTIDGLREIRGSADGRGMRIGIVVSRFNPELTLALARSAVGGLAEAGVSIGDIDVVWVPGAFEIPSVLEPLASSDAYDALIALGAVIQGETVHAQTIGSTVSESISAMARKHVLPIIDGIVVAPDRESADARCLSGTQGRGAYAALAAIEMAHVFLHLPDSEGVR